MSELRRALLGRRSTESAASPVYERVRDAILSGELRPNVRLIEEELAELLGVSRSPVREALLALTQEGLVVRSRGWMVRDHTSEEVLRILEARMVIETSAAALAAERITAEQLDRINALVEEMDTPGLERPTLNDLNRQFHDAITAAAGNFLLDEFSRRTNISYWNFNLGAMQPPTDDQIVNAQHREIVAALTARDPEAARTAVERHLLRTISITSGLVAN